LFFREKNTCFIENNAIYFFLRDFSRMAMMPEIAVGYRLLRVPAGNFGGEVRTLSPGATLKAACVL